MNVFIKTFGCQMNEYDSELVAGILAAQDMHITDNVKDANVLLINTCTVRQHAEDRALGYLSQLLSMKRKKRDLKIGLLGCVAQRHGNALLEHYPGIDFIVGPDGYQLIPDLLTGNEVMDDPLRLGYEQYENVAPLRNQSVTAWVAISRGCNEKCSYCIVPQTRGRERSRAVSAIIKEVTQLRDNGCKEVTLLGQNVNSYSDGETQFHALLEKVSCVDAALRIRFATSHPMNFSRSVLEVMARRPNICPHLHVPVQSGSNRILELMNRKYTYEHFMEMVEESRTVLPSISITTDIISGFPTEREHDHQATVQLVREARFDGAFTFKYSPREGTDAFGLNNDVPEEVKVMRLEEISALVRDQMLRKNQAWIGEKATILIESASRRSDDTMVGRTNSNKKVLVHDSTLKPGDLVEVNITGCTSQSLFGVLTQENETMVFA